MKKIWLFAAFVLLVSCAGAPGQKSAPEQAGWADEDTYTVRVTERDEERAVDKAKHQILKDIVDVRVRNNSRYTDIQMIQEEFNAPLSNGVIISSRAVPEGLAIYFQIREQGLKKKFQRR